MQKRIMVVDDEPAIGKLLLYQLSSFGYQVSYFQDGLEALRRLPATRPDLVLLDVMLPLISGWEVCRQIRACSTVPIIMLTAKSADSDVVTGLGAGADDYVTKPFSMAQLHARIEAVLRRSGAGTSVRALTRSSPRTDVHLSEPALAAPPIPACAHPAEETSLPQIAPETAAQAIDQAPVRIGHYLYATRIARGLTLHQIERATRIRWEFLQAIEQENWGYVPRGELRRSLKMYAEHLGVQLPARMRRPKPWHGHVLLALQFVVLAVVLVLVVVGIYLL